MKILFTVDPEIPVPPENYGGIERIVNGLISEFAAKGHEIYLLANKHSRAPCATHIEGWKGHNSRNKYDSFQNSIQLLKYTKKYKPHIIHSFSRLLYVYPLLATTKFKILQSYQREISPATTSITSWLGNKNIYFSACGNHLFSAFSDKKKWKAIHNFTDTNYFVPARAYKGGYLFFLGRIQEIKGVYEAIQVALGANKQLIIAGNIPDEHKQYFNEKVKPYLTNPLIKYIGPVNDEVKSEYLQNAEALLFPIKWEEPFGIVMAESMACGTPVIGFNRGAVPEVIKNGVNGFIAENVDAMKKAVKKVSVIDRQKVRQDAEQKFSIKVIADQYLKYYDEILNE